MKRRGFLLGLTGALAAPAVVRAESLMKLWVPSKPAIAGRLYLGLIDVGDWALAPNGQIHYRWEAEWNSQTGRTSPATARKSFAANHIEAWPRMVL